MRKKSTCRRTTSSGSVTLTTAASHVTDPAVQDKSGMWTVLRDTGVIRVVTGPLPVIFPAALPGQPWRIQLSGGSDPDGADCGGWCWQSHHVPPGQSS
jgi:hypothetical protein